MIHMEGRFISYEYERLSRGFYLRTGPYSMAYEKWPGHKYGFGLEQTSPRGVTFYFGERLIQASKDAPKQQELK